MVKIVTFFLIFMLILGMFGKLKMPKIKNPLRGALGNRKCEKCGAYKIGKSPCPCDKG